MNNIQQIINSILCDLKELKASALKKISILWNNSLITSDVSLINFTGNVQVTNSDNNVTVNIPQQTGGGGADCDECLEFDGDRIITRNVIGLLGDNLGTQGVIDTLEKLLYPYLAPNAVLTSPPNLVVEKNDNISNISVTATSTKNTNDITLFKLFMDNIEIYDESSVNPNGQTINFVESILNTDNSPLTPYVVSFSATVSDGTTNVNSNTRTRTMVYPYYHGLGFASDFTTLDESEIKNLNKSVVVKSNRNHTFSPSNQNIYFAYPASYGLLSQINDGQFNITPAFDILTETFTMLDGESVVYNIYKSRFLLTESNYTLNFLV
jgi:hypothetical protein